MVRGPIALVGGGEFTPAAISLSSWLLQCSRSDTVVVVPAASAGGNPQEVVERASAHFQAVGARMEVATILSRADAGSMPLADKIAAAAFIYLPGGDPTTLLRVLGGSDVWDGIRTAITSGAVLAASGGSAMALGDRMALAGQPSTRPALGLIPNAIVLPRDHWADKAASIVNSMSVSPTRLVEIDEATALVMEAMRGCRIVGAGSVTLYQQGRTVWKLQSPAEVDNCL